VAAHSTLDASNAGRRPPEQSTASDSDNYFIVEPVQAAGAETQTVTDKPDSD
jgi:hypothetical protein